MVLAQVLATRQCLKFSKTRQALSTCTHSFIQSDTSPTASWHHRRASWEMQWVPNWIHYIYKHTFDLCPVHTIITNKNKEMWHQHETYLHRHKNPNPIYMHKHTHTPALDAAVFLLWSRLLWQELSHPFPRRRCPWEMTSRGDRSV